MVGDAHMVPTAAMVAMGRRLAEVRLSPDGCTIGWVQRSGGPAELILATLPDDGFAQGEFAGRQNVLATLPPIAAPHPSGGGAWCWLPDGTGVVYASKVGLHRAPLDGGAITTLLLAAEGRQLWSPTVDPSGTMLAFVDEGQLDAFVGVMGLAHPANPVRVSLAENDSFVLDPEWGTDGLLAWHTWSAPAMPWDHGRIELAMVASPTGRELAQAALEVVARGSIVGGRVGQPRWCGNRLSWIDDASGFAVVTTGTINRHAHTLVVDARRSISDSCEHAGPTWGPGQRTTAWSPDGDAIAFERNEAGFGRLCVADPSTSTVSDAFSGAPLGRGVHGSLSWAVTPTGRHRIAAVRQGASTPVQVVVYDRAAPSVDGASDGGRSAGQPVWARTIVARSEVMGWQHVNLVEPIEVSAPAPDATMVHGRLYRPEGITGAAPTVVALHGGPTDQSRVDWNARFAAYIAAGWQVLTVDHRGSTGWGRAYQQAMNEQWGVLDVADTVCLLHSLIQTGRVDASRVVASGGSAGGFTVLSLLVAHPDLFAGGIALYPVTDLIALDETTYRFEAHYQRTLIGSRPANEQRYLDRSPLRRAAAIRVPVVLFHGTDDRVVDVAQSDALAAALAASGISHEYVRFEGEGHGWSKPESVAVEHSRVMAFLESITAGRSPG